MRLRDSQIEVEMYLQIGEIEKETAKGSEKKEREGEQERCA